MLALRLPSAAYMVLTRSYYVVKNSAGPEAKALQCDSQPAFSLGKWPKSDFF
jgi:hypothetical protein